MKQVRYRIGQYFRALGDKPDEEGLSRAREILSPQLFNLFSQMLPFEQAHAVRVLNEIEARGYDDSALLQAALLHDVGKARYPLRPWERALAVILRKILPTLAEKWGQGEPIGLRAGLAVKAQHAAWGSEMAAEAGADEDVLWLIHHHQDEVTSQLSEEKRVALDILQRVDAVS